MKVGHVPNSLASIDLKHMYRVAHTISETRNLDGCVYIKTVFGGHTTLFVNEAVF